MKKILTSIGAAVLTAVLAVGSLPAYAAQTGSITIIPQNTETKQYVTSTTEYDGTFRVYRVADYDEYGNFKKATGFEGYSGTEINGDNLSDAEKFKLITQAVTSYIGTNRANLTPVKEGAVVNDPIPNLPWGLYFVEAEKTATGWNAVTSFLVMIPQYSDGKTEVNAVAYPKVTKPTTPPKDEPPGDDNPPGDNPPPKDTPPKKENPPEEETPPETPSEDIGNMDDNGNMNENGNLNEGGALTGDNSQIAVYGAVAGAAAAVLIVWFVWRRKKNKEQ